MKVLFLTLSRINDLSAKGIYTDLLRQFVKDGNDLYIVTPVERRLNEDTKLIKQNGVSILQIKTLNITKTNVVEKGIGTILLGLQFKKAIERYLSDVKFDLVMYSTPPITLTSVISSIKKRCDAKSYLILKDIFPQNAVDMSMFSKRSPFYKFFRNKEIKLYRLSDYIGCMSPANCKYVIEHNSYINPSRVELCPNSIDIEQRQSVDKTAVKNKYNIPINKRIFVYGGNLGEPQGVEFLLDVLKSNIMNDDVFFVIAGSGTQYNIIKKWFVYNYPSNAVLLNQLPRDEYEMLVASCDIGMIFLDSRFTIPNYPSRLLSYLSNAMPILLATDKSTDVGYIAEQNKYGFWSEHGDMTSFNVNLNALAAMSIDELTVMGERGYKYFVENYNVEDAYKTIISHFV